MGSVLAGLLGRDFVDNDRVVEERAGRTIPEIFEAEGEKAFRELEAQAIKAVAKGSAVVALGGGAIAQPGAPEQLASLGTVGYLAASPGELRRRGGRGARDRHAASAMARRAASLSARARSIRAARTSPVTRGISMAKPRLHDPSSPGSWSP